MEREDDLPWGVALAILRVICPQGGRFSQTTLAQVVGLSQSAISRYEAGDRIPPVDQARRLVDAMGYPPYLLERTLSFVTWARAVAPATKSETSNPSSRIQGLAGGAGLWVEDLVRDVLCAVWHEHPANAIPDVDVLKASKALPDRSILSGALTTLRMVRGLERPELAVAAGITERAITRYENGTSKPSLPKLQRILAALHFPEDVFERCVLFVRSALDARRLHKAGGESANLTLLVGEIAAQMARSVENFTRRELGNLTTTVQVCASRRAAPAAWALLNEIAEPSREALIAQVEEFQTVGLCELLCEKSIEATGDDASEAIRFAALAQKVADHVPGPERFRSRVRGFAGVHLANARRAAGDNLPLAVEGFEAALALWQAGAAEDPGLLNSARVLGLEASLRRAQRLLPAAMTLLNQALAMDRWGETSALLVAKARTLEEVGDFAASIDALEQAMPQIDANRHPRRRYVASNLLVLNLCHLGRHAAAELLLEEPRKLARQLNNRLDLLQVDWLAGKIASGQGRKAEALRILTRVREGYLATENVYNVALVTVELAEVHATLGRTAEVKVLARASASVFADQGVHQEARRALALFSRAVEEDRLTVELLENLASFLYQSRNNPELCFGRSV